MGLNEFLKGHRKVEQLQKQAAALTAGLQRVSAQLEPEQARTSNGWERLVEVPGLTNL